MKKKYLYLIIAALLLGTLALSACQPAPTEEPVEVIEEEEPEPTEAMEEEEEAEPTATEEEMAEPTPAEETSSIVIGTTDRIASLDPADAYSVRDWELIKNTGEGLLKWKPGTAELTTGLATSMPEVSDDGLTYTFTLRDGIKFADGTDLTAEMYAEQLSRLITIGPECPNGVANALATPYVESIEATDESTLVFNLKSPVAYFPQIMASASYIPAHPDTFPQDECVLFPEAPVYGVGPWFISQYTQGEQVVLEANEYYNGALEPQVDRIIVRYFADPQTMALAVQNGEIDVAWRILGPELIGQLEGTEGLTVGTINGGSIRYLIINHTKAPTDDPNVNKAIASAIDRDEISDTVFGGQVEPLYSMVPPGFLGANEAFDTMYASPDLEAARGFLADSGYTEDNPLELEMWYPPEHYGASTSAWMEVLEKQLEATNVIDVTLQAQEWSTYVTALTGGEAYNVGVLGWFFDYPDPSNYLDPFVYNGGLGTNVALSAEDSDYGDPINDKAQELVDLLVQADNETDLDTRRELYQEAQEVYADLVVSLPLFFEAEHVVYRDNVMGSEEFASPETLNIGPTLEFNYSTLQLSE